MDVDIRDGRIRSVLPSGESRGQAGPDRVIDAAGGALWPGFHDHHVHIRAAVAARHSVSAGPPEVLTEDDLKRRLVDAGRFLPPGRWVRAVGYHDSVAGDLERWTLEALAPGRPIRLQHRSGKRWTLNDSAVRALALDSRADLPEGVERDEHGRPTGRLWRVDRWLADQLPAQHDEPGPWAAALAARGVTGLTDATPGCDAAELASLARLCADGTIPQRVCLMAPPGVNAGPVDGESAAISGRVSLGPVKILFDDDSLPALSELVGWIRSAHDHGRPAAIHCVTRVQAALALAAFADAGARSGDRIEHGAVLDTDLLESIRRMGLLVVTQPGMAAARAAEYLQDVEPTDIPDLWRLRSLLTARIPVAISSDTPYGPEDPWSGIAAAVTRRFGAGPVLGPAEAVEPEQAMQLMAGSAHEPRRPRRIEPGASADLVLTAEPRLSIYAALRRGELPTVRATLIGGAVKHLC